MKMYTTKYWESNGIEEIDGWSLTDCGQYVATEYNNPKGRRFEKIGKTVFHNRDEAVDAANKFVLKKIACTKKKLAKLNAMIFQ